MLRLIGAQTAASGDPVRIVLRRRAPANSREFPVRRKQFPIIAPKIPGYRALLLF
jgi:hypothetical protein